jgi:hypothetical protein
MYRFSPNLASLFFETRERMEEGQNFGKIPLRSVADEGGSCSKTEAENPTPEYREIVKYQKFSLANAIQNN